MTQVLEKEKSVKAVKKQLIRILPYINPDSENMGLTKYNMVVHDGATQKEALTYLELNKGVRRYLTGLNEFAPEISAIKDSQEKASVIREIRKKVQFLERSLGANDIADIDDEKFWEKVKTVHPTNYSFWDSISVEAGNEPVFLNPEDPNHLIRICAIEAGGFSIISKSYEDAKLAANPPKFYLDRGAETASTKNEIKRIKNEAGALLNDMYKKDQKKLFYVVKNIDPNSYQYKNSTSIETIYDYLDEHITGKGFQNSAKKAAQEFIDVSKLPIEDLRIKAVIADASFYKVIQSKPDGLIYHNATGSMLGRNTAEILVYFKSDLNAKIWDQVRNEIEDMWKN